MVGSGLEPTDFVGCLGRVDVLPMGLGVQADPQECREPVHVVANDRFPIHDRDRRRHHAKSAKFCQGTDIRRDVALGERNVLRVKELLHLIAEKSARLREDDDRVCHATPTSSLRDGNRLRRFLFVVVERDEFSVV
jgi:hypothetical protein